MTDHVYKLIELTGTSTTTMEEAINTALKRASNSVKNLRWFHVTDIRGSVDGDKVEHWQVTVKIGFTVDD